MRLLPLALALAAAALTFGLFGLFGGSLTMASIAVLPILIGLAVDYAIQFQARYDEEVAGGARGAEAAARAAARGGPTIAHRLPGDRRRVPRPAALADADGEELRPAAGRRHRDRFRACADGGFRRAQPAPRERGPRLERPRTIEPRARLGARSSRRAARRTPRRVLGVGLALALIGWGVGTQIESVSDVRELAPQSIREVRDLDELQEATGVSGELDVRIEAPDLTDPATLRWMAGFKRRVLRDNGFSGANPSCLEAEVCPGPALSDFVVGRRRARCAAPTSARPSPNCPPTTSSRWRRPIRRPGCPANTALVSFGIRAQSLEDQQALIERIRGEIGEPGAPGGPPPGVDVELAGLPVIAAAAADDLSSSRYWLTLAGLLAVALALFAVYRSLSRVARPARPGAAGERLVLARPLGDAASRSTRCRRRSGR